MLRTHTHTHIQTHRFAPDTALDSETDRESNFVDTSSHTYTPQLSASSRTILVPQGPAPSYINPPSFEDAIQRSRLHSTASRGSSFSEKPPAEYWEDGSKPGLIDEPLSDIEEYDSNTKILQNSSTFQQLAVPRHEIHHSTRLDYQYESDSVGKPSYASSEITDATEYSHLQSKGDVGYSHLNTPQANSSNATFV